MNNLSDFIQELEQNYNDLLSIYESGSNKTGKSESQLLSQLPNHFSFKQAWDGATDTKLRPKLFALRKNFQKLLENALAVECIAKAVCINVYNVPRHGFDKVRMHLFEQQKKIEFIITSENSEPLVEVILNSGEKGQLTQIFFTLLGEINFKGKLIFSGEIEDFDEFKRKITFFLQQKFDQIESPINFEIGTSARFVAHYIIIQLSELVGIHEKYKSLESIVQINGKPFSTESRNSSQNRQIEPRLNKKIQDSHFESVVKQLSEVINSIL